MKEHETKNLLPNVGPQGKHENYNRGKRVREKNYAPYGIRNTLGVDHIDWGLE